MATTMKMISRRPPPTVNPIINHTVTQLDQCMTRILCNPYLTFILRHYFGYYIINQNNAQQELNIGRDWESSCTTFLIHFPLLQLIPNIECGLHWGYVKS